MKNSEVKKYIGKDVATKVKFGNREGVLISKLYHMINPDGNVAKGVYQLSKEGVVYTVKASSIIDVEEIVK